MTCEHSINCPQNTAWNKGYVYTILCPLSPYLVVPCFYDFRLILQSIPGICPTLCPHLRPGLLSKMLPFPVRGWKIYKHHLQEREKGKLGWGGPQGELLGGVSSCSISSPGWWLRPVFPLSSFIQQNPCNWCPFLYACCTAVILTFILKKTHFFPLGVPANLVCFRLDAQDPIIVSRTGRIPRFFPSCSLSLCSLLPSSGSPVNYLRLGRESIRK